MSSKTNIKNKGSALAWVIVVIAIVIIAGGIYFLTKNSQSSSVTENQKSTYTNTQYSFAYNYPNDFTISSDLTPTEQNHVASYLSTCKDGPDQLSCLYYTGSTSPDFQAAAMSVSASTTVTYDDCTRLLPGSIDASSTDQTTINGVSFYHDSLNDAGLGNRLNDDEYRSYYNGACYEIDIYKAWNVGNGQGPDQAFMSSIDSQLQSILSTFHLTVDNTKAPLRSANTTSEWNTLIGQSIPISFQYPSSLSVQYNNDTGVSLELSEQVGLNTRGGDEGSTNIFDWTGRFPDLGAVKTNNDDPDVAGFDSLMIDGEPALHAETTGNESQWTIYYFAHKGRVYEISIDSPLPGQVNQMLSTFKFTNQ